MQAQEQHAGIGSIFRLLLTLGIFAVLVSVFGPLLRERPSPSSYEWGNEPSPQASPSGTPAGQENGAPNGERDFSSQAEPRPTDVPQATGPVEAGTSSSWGLTGDDAYDCNAMGVDLAQVNLANIKTFMDLAYEGHLQAQQMGDSRWRRRKKWHTPRPRPTWRRRSGAASTVPTRSAAAGSERRADHSASASAGKPPDFRNPER